MAECIAGRISQITNTTCPSLAYNGHCSLAPTEMLPHPGPLDALTAVVASA